MYKLLHRLDLSAHARKVVAKVLLVHYFYRHLLTRQRMIGELDLGKTTCDTNEKDWKETY